MIHTLFAQICTEIALLVVNQVGWCLGLLGRKVGKKTPTQTSVGNFGKAAGKALPTGVGKGREA